MSERLLLPAEIQIPYPRAEWERAKKDVRRISRITWLMYKNRHNVVFVHGGAVLVKRMIESVRLTHGYETLCDVHEWLTIVIDAGPVRNDWYVANVHNAMARLDKNQHHVQDIVERKQVVGYPHIDTVWLREYRRGRFSFDTSNNPYRECFAWMQV